VRGKHDVGGFVVGKIKEGLQDMHDKIHWRDIVVVDDDLIERFELGLGLFDNLDFGEGEGIMNAEG
jgi:hypothetical protein